MDELRELDKRHEEFAKRNVRVVAISNDDQAKAKLTQAEVPHLVVVADTAQNLAKAVQVIHPGMGPAGSDTNAPTMFLIDGAGKVRWLFRADRFVERLPPETVLSAIDAAMTASR